MKVIHLNTSDYGGAGEAVYRLHKGLIEKGIESEMWVNRSSREDCTIKGPIGTLSKFLSFIRRYIKFPILKLFQTQNPILHSISILPSKWVKKVNQSDADIINLHWIQHEMLSISDISRIQKPIVWSIHDMWIFCGAEHIAWDSRWKDGYTKKNQPAHEKGLDINRWTWSRKYKHWKKPLQIVAPSRAYKNFVKNSKLIKSWPVTTIPNIIDENLWKPVKKDIARKLYDIKDEDFIILFGTSNANLEHHKGFDLLSAALKLLYQKNKKKNIKLMVFGQSKPHTVPDLGFSVQYLGYIYDQTHLCQLYSLADAMAVPSRQESFCQVACEAHACALPVIAFNTGGLSDIVDHKKTGYLAKKFDVTDYCNGIEWVFENRIRNKLGEKARQRILNNFNKELSLKKYIELYKSIIK
jgi:glycosyltransferase involved in cell wall biosynthesis